MLNVSLCTLYVFYCCCLCRYMYCFTLFVHICVFHFAFLLFSQAEHPFWLATCNLLGQAVVPCLCLAPPAVERRWRHCTRNRNTTFTTVLRISEKIHVMRKLPMPSSRRELLIRLSFHLSHLFYLSLNGKMKFISDFVSFQFSLKVAPVNEGEIHIERMDK